MTSLMQRIQIPSPKWFRIAKKTVSWITNLTLGVLVFYIPEESKPLLIGKIIQSTTMEFIDAILVEIETT